jgi:hypothetical protein
MPCPIELILDAARPQMGIGPCAAYRFSPSVRACQQKFSVPETRARDKPRTIHLETNLEGRIYRGKWILDTQLGWQVHPQILGLGEG